MNSIKCAECGLVNFSSATECKRCHATLHKPGVTSAAVPVVNDTVESDEILSPIKNDPPQVVLAPLPEYLNAEPAPFTGWVILFAACLGLSILVFLIQLKVLIDFMGSRGYLLATDQGLAGLGFYNPIVEPLTYAELLLKGAELVAALGVMVLLLRKSWAFLRWVRIYLFATALYQLAEIVAGLILRESFVKKLVIKPTQLAEIQVGVGVLSAAASILISLLWAAYFEKSERVRKVFIN